mgnify:CR=1 FL=1
MIDAEIAYWVNGYVVCYTNLEHREVQQCSMYCNNMLNFVLLITNYTHGIHDCCNCLENYFRVVSQDCCYLMFH